MKRFIQFILFIVIPIATLNAQTTSGFKYQAVARNSDGSLLLNQPITVKLEITDANGLIYYSETQNTTTSDLGIFSLNVGQGSSVQGSLAEIPWTENTFNLDVYLDVENGNSPELVGSSSILGVPYAMYAERAGKSMDDQDTDPTNELQTLQANGDQITLSGDTTLTVIDLGDLVENIIQAMDQDTDPTNELQSLEVAGDEISLTNDNTNTIIKLGPIIREVLDTTGLDSDATNEIQQLSKIGNTIMLSRDGGEVTDAVEDADADPENELQKLSKNGNKILLSGNGGEVTDAVEDADADPQNELQKLTKNGSKIRLSGNGGEVTDAVNDADADPQNEIQRLSLSGNTLSISQGNSVDLKKVSDGDSDPANELQDLSINGANLSISGGKGVQLPLYWQFEKGNSIEGIPDIIDADYRAQVPSLQVEGGPLLTSSGIRSTDDVTLLGANYYLKTTSSQNRIRHYISGDAGTSIWYGPNGRENAVIKGDPNNRNNGKISIYDSNGSIQASMEINSAGKGVLAADIKNFFMDDPEHEDQQIWYASLEGPEAGAYVRGQIELVDGEAAVTFPDHFLKVATLKGLTITLTPNSADSKGLAAVDRTANGFVIRELFHGTGNYTVDWEAKSIRKGFEDYEVIRQKKEN